MVCAWLFWLTDTMEHSLKTFRYAELHCLSNFSFLRGASHPEELVQRANELNYEALAITDECSVAGVVCAHREIKEHQLNIKLIVGSEFNYQQECYVLLAPHRQGYAELCQFITRCRRAAVKGSYDFKPEWLLDLKHCLLLWRGPSLNEKSLLMQHFNGRLWLLAERLLDEHDDVNFDRILQLAAEYKLPVTCANHVHMHSTERHALQDCLTAIRHNTAINDIAQHLFSNAERHLRSPKKLQHLYSSALLNSTLDIANRCQFSLDEIAYQYPEDGVPKGQNASDYLRDLVEKGQKIRFPNGSKKAIQETIEKELKLIKSKGYEHYFITLYDVVQFARSQDILCQGRGSAANSIVCYCLFLTEVNPEEVQLLFERFISEERHEPPDIDIDFESQRREEVIQYIYRTYGRERAALTATVIRYKPRSALRDVGKSLGLNKIQLEHVMARYAGRYHSSSWLDAVFPLSETNPHQARFRSLIEQLLTFPRHLSQHVGGFVIANGLLGDLVPIENASMPDRTVIQWDKEDLETLGLMKVDILSLGMMTAIRRSLQALNITMSDIPREDPATYAMLQRADSVGVFQVESRAQMNMLPRLKPRTYYDLVIQVSIVRPGPIHGDMVHPYLKRRNGEEVPDYPMAALKPILERTYGVPLFQEQVIAFAMVAANFSAAEADQLRRSMASWRKKGHMHILQQRLRTNMLKNGFSEEYIARIQRQLEGFGEYGFPESHAASFALLVYITAWLKCHHPAIYLAALLNSQPMGFYSPAQLIEDARHHSVTIEAVDINHSNWDHSANHNAVRLGLRLVKGLQRDSALRLCEQRPIGGYKSIQECMRAANLNKHELEALASANAFGDLAEHRYHARWQVAEPQQGDLLRNDLSEDSGVWPLSAPNEVADLLEDYHSMGVTLGRHPIEILREQGHLGSSITALGLRQLNHGDECFVSGLVTCRQRLGTAAGVTFVTLEDETGCTNVVVWLRTAQQQLQTLLNARIMQVYGHVEKDSNSGVTHLMAYRLLDLSSALKQLEIKSHDFH
ncbi:error-prone DNA polymerase [Thalassolituus oleivorans]|uniref:error-prone DNA polymerase n=1 Tax=Thalassolituus oleivorans TaxID=187493 RepID=UPI0023F00D0C|nr:error-prone DNA polymerase [Thalassolituus oleivorans]